MEQIKKLIAKEVERNLTTVLETMEPDKPEYKKVIDTTNQLLDEFIELERMELEQKKVSVEAKKIEAENKAQEQQTSATMKDEMIKNVISVCSVAIPAALTVWGTVKSLKFEETGTVTTIVGRGFINKILPRR